MDCLPDKYVALRAMTYSGRQYRVGDTVPMPNDAAAARLLNAGFILRGDWPPRNPSFEIRRRRGQLAPLTETEIEPKKNRARR